MTPGDIHWFRMCYQLGLVRSPLLEIGSAKVHDGVPNVCDVARDLGIQTALGADLVRRKGVDIVYDFAQAPDTFEKEWKWGSFHTVAIFNTLEHTFDPILVLRNALSCVAPGGRF